MESKKRKATTKEVTDESTNGNIKKETAGEERKSKFALWWENHEPTFEIVDMRAALK
jgi:hypothetical protein